MSNLLASLHTLHFSSPLFLLVALPLAAAFAYQTWGEGSRRAFATSDVYSLALVGQSKAKTWRALLVFASILLLAMAWADPRVTTSSNIPFTERTAEFFKHFIVLFDVSYSMTEKMDRGAAPTRYHVAREAFYQFVQNQKNERIGLVLFSDRPFTVTYPSRDISFLQNFLFQDDISGGHLSQLSPLSLGTDIAPAFSEAEKNLQKAEYANDKVFVLITDLGLEAPQAKEFIAKMKSLRQKDIRVYILGIATDTSVLKKVQEAFDYDDGVRVFSAASSGELREAFALISSTERQRDRVTPDRAHTYEVSIRAYFAGLALVLLVLLVVLSEGKFFTILKRRAS